jgi:hypothetical protein
MGMSPVSASVVTVGLLLATTAALAEEPKQGSELPAISSPDAKETRKEAARACVVEQREQEHFDFKAIVACMIAKGHYGPTFKFTLPPGTRFRFDDPSGCTAVHSMMVCMRRDPDGGCKSLGRRLTSVPVPCSPVVRSL